MGTCVALHAARRCDPLREPVVLIEKDRLGAGSSGRNAAILHQGYTDRAMAGMSRDALKVYASMKSTTGRSVGYCKTGVLLLAGPDPEQIAALEREVAMQQSIGINVNLVRGEELHGIMPGIEVDEGAVGAWQPDGGFVDPGRTIEAFAALARAAGAVTRTGVSEPKVLIKDGRAVGVETSDGVFHAPNVVLATGPWTPSILKDLGVELPLRVARTHECFLRMPSPADPEEDEDEGFGGSEFETRFVPDPLDRMPVAHPVLVDFETGLHARCEPVHGRTRIGQLDFEDCEMGPSGEPDPQTCKDLRARVGRRLPIYKDQDLLGGATTLASLTPDGLPMVGPIEQIPGLFVVAGLTGNDFHLAPSIGEGMAQQILGQPVSAFDPDPFSPSRFR
jgi:glycine/D-amino acid oxidase-like deaminating enzyme